MVGTTVLALFRIDYLAELGLATPDKYQVLVIQLLLVKKGTGPSVVDLTWFHQLEAIPSKGVTYYNVIK